jgi:hypothetical protein
VVTPDKGLFFCFNAKVGGDQVALVAHLKEMTTNEAANWLAGTVPQNNRTKAVSTTSPPAPPVKAGFDPERYAGRLDQYLGVPIGVWTPRRSTAWIWENPYLFVLFAGARPILTYAGATFLPTN